MAYGIMMHHVIHAMVKEPHAESDHGLVRRAVETWGGRQARGREPELST